MDRFCVYLSERAKKIIVGLHLKWEREDLEMVTSGLWGLSNYENGAIY